jgi:nucleoside-diphosphate-sugar epimerase
LQNLPSLGDYDPSPEQRLGPGRSGTCNPAIHRCCLIRPRYDDLWGRQGSGFVWIGDVLDAFTAAAAIPEAGNTINVGPGIPVSLADLAQRIVALMGSNSRIRYEPARDFDVDRFVADIRLAEAVLEFQPQKRVRYRFETSKPGEPLTWQPVTLLKRLCLGTGASNSENFESLAGSPHRTPTKGL